MEQPINSRKEKLYEIIFKSDTPAGKAFDVVLIIMIVFSSLVVLVDSISSIHEGYGPFLYAMEWFFTIIFTIEYLLRIYCVESKLRYIGQLFRRHRPFDDPSCFDQYYLPQRSVPDGYTNPPAAEAFPHL